MKTESRMLVSSHQGNSPLRNRWRPLARRVPVLLGASALLLAASGSIARAGEAPLTALTPDAYIEDEYGTEVTDDHRSGVTDVASALQTAVDDAIALGLPLDLGGNVWRISQTVVGTVGVPIMANSSVAADKRQTLHLRNGTILVDTCPTEPREGANGVGLLLTPGEENPDGYVSPIIENVSFVKKQGSGCQGLKIQRGHHVRMQNVGFSNFRNAGEIGLVLDHVQVLSWIGGMAEVNNQHMLVVGSSPDFVEGGYRSTDIKVSAVWFQDSRAAPQEPEDGEQPDGEPYVGGEGGVTLDHVAGVSFISCSFDISRVRPLVEVLGSSHNISFFDSRFEKPSAGYGSDDYVHSVSNPAVLLGDGVNTVRFVGNFFGNPGVQENGESSPIIGIPQQLSGTVSFISNSFPGDAWVVEDGAPYRSIMNTNLGDH